jgi:hypothetical protein
VKEISSMDFPQHGEVFYFSGQALIIDIYIFILSEDLPIFEQIVSLANTSEFEKIIFWRDYQYQYKYYLSINEFCKCHRMGNQKFIIFSSTMLRTLV